MCPMMVDVRPEWWSYGWMGGAFLKFLVLWRFWNTREQSLGSGSCEDILEVFRSLNCSSVPVLSELCEYNIKLSLFSACIMAILAGLMFGSSFVPMLYIKHHATSNSSMFTGSSQNGKNLCVWVCLINCLGEKITHTWYISIILHFHKNISLCVFKNPLI